MSFQTRYFAKALLLFLSFSPHFLNAQNRVKEWTLDECISLALVDNIEIKQKELDLKTKEVALSESRWAYAPSFSFSSSATMATGRVLDQTTYEFVRNNSVNSSSASIYGSMSLFNGFRKHHSLKKAELAIEAASTNIEAKKRRIQEEVIGCFLSVLCARANLESMKQRQSLYKSQLERIQTMVDAGRVTESDYYQAKAQLFSTESDLALAEGEYDKARISLCQLLEVSDWQSFAVSEEGIDLPSIDVTYSMDSESIMSHPEYRSFAIEKELAQKDLSISKSQYWPTVSLSAGYGTSSSSARQKMLQNGDGTYKYEAYPFLEQYVDNASSYVSINLSLPIFNAMNTKNSVRRNKIALQNAEYELIRVKKELTKEYLNLLMDAKVAYNQYTSAEEQLKNAEEAERMVREKYNLGATDFNTWDAAATELVRAKCALTNAKYAFAFNRIELNLYNNSLYGRGE